MHTNLLIETPAGDFFVPAALWNRAYEREADHDAGARPVVIGLLRHGQPMARQAFRIRSVGGREPRTFHYVERLLKFMLWAFGGDRILVAGPDDLRSRLQRHYRDSATGRFDAELIGRRLCGAELAVESAEATSIPFPAMARQPLGGHLDGCRIGFDLGGSDRKCAALIDGRVVFSEEIRWDPYFQRDPHYHYEGIQDSLRRAAAHLPRIDAIGGSAAGVYVDNEVKVSSLFRGVAPADFETHVRHLFHRLQAKWNRVPFVVVNDGEVSALAGAMALDDHAVLGLSMGTSLAAGYVTPQGGITPWLNELAFAPVDYSPDGPVDEWSGDRGCGVQFFSQQGVARLANTVGLAFAPDLPADGRLTAVQSLLEQDDPRAGRIYDTLGLCLGYTLAHYAHFYDFRHVLLLGRVVSGDGGRRLIEQAEATLRAKFPALADRITVRTLDETMKRHGQAVAAASLPVLAAAETSR